ncbi:tRNA (adenosine(37)-N6)-threonylcarbamoyltransferase complex dimerization subunit type 1 TsaB [Algoriphagus sp. AK58]|uniref:tRNA (adenosine(37)-N6)-threonylcarbamoyltransferase complex dimerization subunit type 1 TsaB n=1 Tax=Algoriphagus sp. AK58 TaxID=1406877 RepID=UPI00164F9F51|nr:tRNA (adenosine(37)-N6)-threonylcarbamoyltransferase complex dimerization subunit type 1 TsaB [Algoriphagus sp. AK58]MBC6368952.1 tRNA (adenosine(37)-N6)-threonylcarbamoyltransferase complex dimerization subunit type 1 TsaB [Algoriphagus sp. AK58]
MGKILSIETSTSVCSVAVHEFGNLIALEELNESGAHAEKLMGLIDLVLYEAGLSYKELDAIAVSEGPGSYTGLRIGVSTAKGLAFALDRPLIGINTLQAIASCYPYSEGEIRIAVLDARRMEVYSQAFGENLQELSAIESIILEEGAYRDYLEKGKVYFSGDAVSKVKSVLTHQNAVFLENPVVSAKNLGKLAYGKLLTQSFEDIAYFVPNYLKEFKALHSKKNPLLSL